MGRKLYVGNLSFTVDSEQLGTVFSEAGSVASVNVLTDRETGRSKGFAFVEMSTDEEAQDAIHKLNGIALSGRPLNVSEARPQENRFSSNRRGGAFGSRRSY
ncbi:RNA-binding protein [Bdellovibrio bacteriovorus]|uniref:RNA-binding protein n=1 Tax=Bdellovibrio bacteriovorus TaxID=959 RepID=A0A150WC63_BDEBC|nr:RNA-binding protein [Bdellovibrio bacteriovorus]KYG60635.1 RNA-binding protein [Bdellovibrio bacteriovorus]KYG69166.1 RNA-binding protein [Bdellovibrio bacteriovorus]